MNLKDINGAIKGSVSFDDIKFEKIKTTIIKPNNTTSGKINFSAEDIGKTVYILYPHTVEDFKKMVGEND